MNKKITLYELLGLIKDNKAPKKIKVTRNAYEYDELLEWYYTRKDGFRVMLGGVCGEINFLANAFNENLVEILEEDNEKESFQFSMIPSYFDLQSAIKVCNSNFEKHQKAFYKLIDEVNKLKEGVK